MTGAKVSYLNDTLGEVPKRLKGLASNTSRSETAQGFKSLLLRYAKKRQQKIEKSKKLSLFL